MSPSIAMIPIIASPIPALLAIHIPWDHIFSPKIIPANNAIHNKFIHPKDTINRQYGKQHPMHLRPWCIPIFSAPDAPFLRLLIKKYFGESQYPRHFLFNKLN